MNGEFKELSPKKIQSLTTEEKIAYYKRLKEEYLKKPYDEKQKAKLDKNFLNAGKVIIPLTDFLYHPKGINTESEIERIDNMGFIYVCNHLSSLDQFPLISVIGKEKPLTVLAKDTLLKLKRGILYKHVGCEFINLNSFKSMNEALDELTKHVFRGRDVLIFPEGTRNVSEKFMLDFKPGAVMVAQKTGTKIVPFAINEDYRIDKNNYLYVRRGEPMTISYDDNIKDANERLEETVRTLMWENMELERQQRVNELDSNIKMEASKYFENKRLKLEKQRKKIN